MYKLFSNLFGDYLKIFSLVIVKELVHILTHDNNLKMELL
jgi:hypothetical protein